MSFPNVARSPDWWVDKITSVPLNEVQTNIVSQLKGKFGYYDTRLNGYYDKNIRLLIFVLPDGTIYHYNEWNGMATQCSLKEAREFIRKDLQFRKLKNFR